MYRRRVAPGTASPGSEWKLVWDDPVGRRRYRILLRRWERMWRRIQAYAKRQGDSPLQLLCADELHRRGDSLCRGGLRPEGEPVWHNRVRRGQLQPRLWVWRAFKLTPKGKETVLYSFCAQTGCTDGNNPYAGVVFDQNGNLYGTTLVGGIPTCNYDTGCGVAFELTPKGKETVLDSFCPQWPSCTDGDDPLTGLVFDQKGNLYGTTLGGGQGAASYSSSPHGSRAR